MRLAIIFRARLDSIDGIRDYSIQLMSTLAQQRDVSVSLYLIDPGSGSARGSWVHVEDSANGTAYHRERLCHAAADAQGVILQYNPFAYGPWGCAPWLPLAVLGLRRRRPRPMLALMIHEPYIHAGNWRYTIMRLWQRPQLWALRRLADATFCSIEAWSESLARERPRRPITHLPVGSNLPDERRQRDFARAQLGIADDEIALVAFGTDHPSRWISYLGGAVTEVARGARRVHLLNLGAGVPAVDVPAKVCVHTPGRLADRDLARWLSAGDIFMAPFLDGVSTRRTTLMAALQHGLPVVGTEGHLTDRLLREPGIGLELVPAGRQDLFARCVGSLARDRERRIALGMEARALYESQFDWPVITSRMLDVLRPGIARP